MSPSPSRGRTEASCGVAIGVLAGPERTLTRGFSCNQGGLRRAASGFAASVLCAKSRATIIYSIQVDSGSNWRLERESFEGSPAWADCVLRSLQCLKDPIPQLQAYTSLDWTPALRKTPSIEFSKRLAIR